MAESLIKLWYQTHSTLSRHPPHRRLEPQQTRERRGNLDRSTTFALLRERHDPGCHRSRRSRRQSPDVRSRFRGLRVVRNSGFAPVALNRTHWPWTCEGSCASTLSQHSTHHVVLVGTKSLQATDADVVLTVSRWSGPLLRRGRRPTGGRLAPRDGRIEGCHLD